MSTHPVAVKRRADRRRNSRILIALLVLALIAIGGAASANLTPDTTAPDSVVASKSADLKFTSPTRSVNCELTKDLARCEVIKPSFAPPIPCPATMDVRIDNAMPVAAFTCTEGPIADAKQPLAYGDVVKRGDLVCRSYVSSMRCSNTATLHGFSISHDAFIVF